MENDLGLQIFDDRQSYNGAMKRLSLAALLVLICACGAPPAGAPPAHATSPSGSSAASSSAHGEMVATMDRFLRDPGAGDAAAILRFVGESPAVRVVYDQRLVPGGKGLPDGAGMLLLAGYAAGSARRQLTLNVKGDSPLEGVRGMLAVYRFLKVGAPSVAIPLLDELVAREADGSLAAAVAERLQRPRDATTQLGAAGLAAFARLASADTFADEAVGVAGLPSDNVVAFRILLAELSAGDAFARLLRDAGSAGQLYALAGLWHTDRAAFEQAVSPMARSTANVAVRFGCSEMSLPIARLVEGGRSSLHIAAGQTLSEAVIAAGGSGAALDMVGGGYPVAFAEKNYRAK